MVFPQLWVGINKSIHLSNRQKNWAYLKWWWEKKMGNKNIRPLFASDLLITQMEVTIHPWKGHGSPSEKVTGKEPGSRMMTWLYTLWTSALGKAAIYFSDTRIHPGIPTTISKQWVDLYNHHGWTLRVLTGWWFQIFFIFIPTWENDPIWLIFLKWVETTN